MAIISPIRIVTGANENHGNSLVQLLRSLAKWERHSPVAVYDLGLAPKHVAAIGALGLSLTRFPYENYPPYFDITVNAGEYAWKPAIVNIELRKTDSPLVWLDAGDVVRFPLLWVRHCLKTVGFYSHRSSGTMARWTHPGMYEALGIPVGWAGDRKPLNGSCIAFNPRFAAAQALADAWFRGAMDKDVIAPAGSDRTNHRQDQALISLLAYRSGIISKPSGGDRALVTHQDVPE